MKRYGLTTETQSIATQGERELCARSSGWVRISPIPSLFEGFLTVSLTRYILLVFSLSPFTVGLFSSSFLVRLKGEGGLYAKGGLPKWSMIAGAFDL